MIVAPIHTGTVDGRPIRFFPSPVDDGKGEFAWVSFVDLLVACDIPMKVREAYFDAVWDVPGGEVVKVPTPTGTVVIVSHSVAQGILGAATYAGHCLGSLRHLYDKAAVAALNVLTEGMSPWRMVEFMGEALLRGRA
jgi:hypothetical protein